MKTLLRILFIDDSCDDAFFLERTLSSLPWPIYFEHHETLKAGLTSLKNSVEPFDLLISDLNLPDSPASQTFEYFYKRSFEPKVILMSGVFASEPDRTESSQGIFEFVNKDLIMDVGFFEELLVRAIPSL